MGFGDEITQVEPFEVNFTDLICCPLLRHQVKCEMSSWYNDGLTGINRLVFLIPAIIIELVFLKQDNNNSATFFPLFRLLIKNVQVLYSAFNL